MKFLNKIIINRNFGFKINQMKETSISYNRKSKILHILPTVCKSTQQVILSVNDLTNSAKLLLFDEYTISSDSFA